MSWYKLLSLVMDEVAKQVVIDAVLKGKIVIFSPDNIINDFLLKIHGKTIKDENTLPN